MAVGGLVNNIEIAERQHCEFQLFIPCDRAAERERATVLVGLAGWRAEYLWHGRGGSRDEEDYNEKLELGLQQLRNGFLLDEEHDDDSDALADLLRLTPGATDQENLRAIRQLEQPLLCHPPRPHDLVRSHGYGWCFS